MTLAMMSAPYAEQVAAWFAATRALQVKIVPQFDASRFPTSQPYTHKNFCAAAEAYHADCSVSLLEGGVPDGPWSCPTCSATRIDQPAREAPDDCQEGWSLVSILQCAELVCPTDSIVKVTCAPAAIWRRVAALFCIAVAGSANCGAATLPRQCCRAKRSFEPLYAPEEDGTYHRQIGVDEHTFNCR